MNQIIDYIVVAGLVAYEAASHTTASAFLDT